MDEELFARYDRLLLQSTLDLMADVVYCPRKSCGTAVMVEPDTTMGICSACQYAFCTLCKLGYHGVSNCKLRAGNVCVFIAMFFFSFAKPRLLNPQGKAIAVSVIFFVPRLR